MSETFSYLINSKPPWVGWKNIKASGKVEAFKHQLTNFEPHRTSEANKNL